MSDAKQLILVDGSTYLYRAFHALPSRLSTTTGQPTGVVYGVVNMMRRLIKEHRPERMVVVFDAPGKNFRDALYAEYKANRPPMPSELRSQLDEVHTVLRAMGLPLLQVTGVEADDVIGALAVSAAAAGERVLISSGDKDLTQLISDRIEMVDGMKGVVYDREGVIGKFGVPPERIVDYLTLIGDAVDNVPGVPKVGPKTAVKWLGEYGSLDNIVEHADDIQGKVGENLRNSLDLLPLSRQLVTIKTDIDLGLADDALTVRPPDLEALRDCFKRLQFKSWLSDLGAFANASESAVAAAVAVETPAVPAGVYETITDEKTLRHWIKRLLAAPLASIHCCNASAAGNPHEGELIGIALSDKAGSGAYLPFAHDFTEAPTQLPRDKTLAALKPLLADPKRLKVGHNLKNDAILLGRCGIAAEGLRYDTMLESYVLDSVGSRHDCESLWFKYLGHEGAPKEKSKGRNKPTPFNQLALTEATARAAAAADLTLQLHDVLWAQLEKLPPQQRLFDEIEMPLVPVLMRVENNGVGIDAGMLQRQGKDLDKRIDEIERHAHQSAGVTFNIASPKQIQEVLYVRLQLPTLRKTPGGQPSTAEPVLEELAHQYELPRLILEHRGLSKLRSTYTDKLPELINPHSGRIHTSYHQAVAATGRLSSSDPNLQNIPIRTGEGRRIREAFVPRPGYVLVSADYSQIELRIMAHLSEDEGLLEAFRRGEDIHRSTAAEVFGIAPDKVNDDQRRHAKAINFGLIYGMSAFGLAAQLHIVQNDARKYIERYFARYPGVKQYMDNTRTAAHERGYVETLFGRRLYLPEINAPNHNRRQYAERTAINAPMQGSAADLIKMAMIKVDHWITNKAPAVRMIMQVHDELVFEVTEAEVERVGSEVSALMSSVGGELKVPLEVEVGSGGNWAVAHS